MKKIKLGLLAFSVVSTLIAHAQDSKNLLTGIKDVGVAVFVDDLKAKTCKLSQKNVRDTIVFEIEKMQISVPEKIMQQPGSFYFQPHLFAYVRVLEADGGLCIINYEITYRKWLISENAQGGFFDNSFLMYGDRSYIDRYFLTEISNHMSKFNDAWRKANLR